MFFDLRWRILCALGAVVMFSASAQTSCARGMRQNNNNNQAQPKVDIPPVPADDPSVHEAAPPPDDAKLITKVGWCEVQVFGHTFSDAGLVDASLPAQHMHLPKRLEQLSQKVQFEPKKSGMQLMDDVDALVKYVYSNKKAPASTGSSSPAPAVVPAKKTE